MHSNTLTPPSHRRRVAFVLLPGFSLLAHASAIEPLQMANQLSGHMLYHTVTLSLDDEPVRSGAQLSLLAQHTLSAPLGPMDLLFICAPTPLPYALPAKLNEWLRSHQGRGVAFGGLAGGTEVLARCGLLEGYRATLPWQRFDAFAQAYPQVTLSQQLFEIDRDRLTCAGGTAAMDMMLTLIGKHHGPRLAEQVSQQFVCDRIRLADERQHVIHSRITYHQ